MERDGFENLSPEGKRVALYIRQKELLDVFLQKGAITGAQYDKSLGDLTEKMGMRDVLDKITSGGK